MATSAMDDEQRITICKTCVSQIYSVMATSPQDRRDYVNLARSIMAHIDSTTFLTQDARRSEQVWMISGLQRLAHGDGQDGVVQDIASWCYQKWLVIQQRDPQNVAVLTGMACNWMGRAQPALSRINHGEKSYWTSLFRHECLPIVNPSHAQPTDDEPESPDSPEERIDEEDCVEARAYVYAATDYLSQAVASARELGVVTGDLLSMAAEAYITLGNVSSSRENEHYFRIALQHLREVESISDFVLNSPLQSFLEEYGRLY